MKKKNRQFAFNATPMIKARRTKFNTLSHSVKTSMNVGTLYPVYIEEVIPGDTFKVKENHVTRLTSSFIRPPMDMIYQDTYFFFCPSRLYYDRWNEVFGENPNGPWANESNVVVPGVGDMDDLNINVHKIVSGSVGDYMTLPLVKGIDWARNKKQVSVIPFRAFADIWNYYFRDENVTDPVHIIKGETGRNEYFNDKPWSPDNYLGMLPKVSKFHDYFTSCLPSPQKGEAVDIQIGTGFLPLDTNGSNDVNTFRNMLRFRLSDDIAGDLPPVVGGHEYVYPLSLVGDPDAQWRAIPVVEKDGQLVDNSNPYSQPIVGSNLGVYLDGSIQGPNVNDLRYAFQLQKLLEKDSRGGNRLQEYILAHFGVSTPDMRMQVPEFLGGRRCPLNVQQVAQTAPQGQNDTLDYDTYLGDLGAYSLSNGDSKFSKGFTEHGWIIGVSCMRYHHTYQQGIDKMFTRRERLDFYDPVFANIGEQPVYKSELFVNDDSTSLSADIFGYQEAWADMRHRSNKVTGQMRSNINGSVPESLDVWHFADEYSSAPSLSQSFIEETPIFVDRTISVPSVAQDQFIVEYWFDVEAVREMPLYSIPGLIDHH